MKKSILLIGMMFILMFSLVSAELSSLDVHYKLNGNGLDEFSNYDLSSITGTINYDLDTPLQVNNNYSQFINSTNQYIRSDFSNVQMDSFTVSNGKSFSISFWLKINETEVRSNILGVDENDNSGFIKAIIDMRDDGINFHYKSNSPSLTIRKEISESYYNDGNWHLYVATFNSSSSLTTFSIDNLTSVSTSTSDAEAGITGVFVGSSYNIGGTANFKISDIKYYNEVLTNENINEIFLYGEANYTTPISHNYTLSLSQNPENITSETIGDLNINLSVSDDVGTLNNNTSATINLDVISTANNNCGIINQNNNYECLTLNQTSNMTYYNNSLFTSLFDETQFIPAIYPIYDQEYLEEQVKSNYGLYSGNYFMYEVYNLTTNQTNRVVIETNIYPNNILVEDSVIIYYCNSTYISGKPSSQLGTSCTILEEILPSEEPDHCHTANSCHYVKQLPTDITWSPHSYFIIKGTGVNVVSSWNARYITNTTYELGTRSFKTSVNSGVTWTISNNLFDTHVHQFAESDGIIYNVTYNDDETGNYFSDTYIDYFDFVNNPPTPVTIYTPNTSSVYVINSTGVDILFNWSNTTDEEGDYPITYKVAISNNGFSSSENISEILSDTNFTKSFNSNDYVNGNYRVFVYAFDSLGNYDISSISGTFNICVSDWQPNEGVCINGVANVTYVDSNSCSIEYDKPVSYLTNCSIDETNESLNLIIIWVLFGLLSIFLITKTPVIGWLLLSLVVFFFSFATLSSLTDVTIIHVMGYLMSVVFFMMSLFAMLFSKE